MSENSLLIIGASRGLGYAMAEEFLKLGWNVVGTVRGDARTKLRDLADRSSGRVEMETIDITSETDIAALRSRVSGRQFDMLYQAASQSTRLPQRRH